MRFFNRFKKQNHNNETYELERLAQKRCVAAMDFAKEFDKELDFSSNSVESLEEILDFYSKDISVSKPTDNQIWSMSIIFGSYLGETILKNGLLQKGYHWGKDSSSNIPLLIGKDGGCLTPIDKIYKRLVNGSEDNVVSFYRFAVNDL